MIVLKKSPRKSLICTKYSLTEVVVIYIVLATQQVKKYDIVDVS